MVSSGDWNVRNSSVRDFNLQLAADDFFRHENRCFELSVGMSNQKQK